MDTTKSGWKTTEFWLALMPWITIGLCLILLAFGQLDKEVGLIVLGSLGIGGGISTWGYTQNRAVIKKSNTGFTD